MQILIQELACRFVADIIRCAGNEYVFHRASSSLRLAVLLLDLTLAIAAVFSYHNGALRFSVKALNMTLKLTLIRSASP